MADRIPPIAFTWDGDSMVPRHPRLADRHFVVGETYTLEPREDRSSASHRHYFAAIKEAHDSLPEEAADRLPSPEHLRKFCLIKAGYRDERSIVCSSKAEAQRLAAWVRPMDEFAIVAVQGATVIQWTAKSQSVRAMGKAEFEASKDAVLNVIASLIGTDATTLRQRATEAA